MSELLLWAQWAIAFVFGSGIVYAFAYTVKYWRSFFDDDVKHDAAFVSYAWVLLPVTFVVVAFWFWPKMLVVWIFHEIKSGHL